MSNMSLFMKKNKAVKENTTYAATKSLCDADGNPVLWEIKTVSTKESEKIKGECIKEAPVKGKGKGKSNQYKTEFDYIKYNERMIVESVVFPDLLNAELQDSYGVKTPGDLLKEMIDSPSEYNELLAFVQQFSGFSKTIDEEIEEAKN